MKTTKTSSHTVAQLGLQTLRAVVILMMFAATTFILSTKASISAENSFEQYQDNAEILKIIKN